MFYKVILVCCFIATCFFNAFAASNSSVPSNIYPATLEKRALDSFTKKGVDKTIKEEPGYSPQMPEKPKGETFVLKDISFQGNHNLSESELSSVVAPYLDTKVNLNSLRRIAGNVQNYYRSRGYMLVKVLVPTQNIKNGEVKFTVVEGKISHVRLKGDYNKELLQNDHLGIVEGVLDKIKDMRPVSFEELQRYMLLLDDLNTVEAVGTIEPLSAQEAKGGAVGMVIELKKSKSRRVTGSIGADNFGSKYAGPYQFNAGANVKQILLPYDEIMVRGLSTVPQKEVRYILASYTTPINSYGTIFGFNVNSGKTIPGDVLKKQNIRGMVNSKTVSLTHPLVRSKAFNWYLDLKFNSKNVKTNVLGTNLYSDKLRIVKIATNLMTTVDRFAGSNIMTFGYSKGLNSLGASKFGSVNLSRANGKPDFRKIEAQYTRIQKVTSQFNAFGNVSYQHAFDSLLSSEQFGFGGQEFGRGYDSSDILGDNGVAALLELRYVGLPKANGFIAQPFTFIDYGKVWNKRIFSDADKSKYGYSAGLGLRVWHTSNVSGALYGAFPLRKQLGMNLPKRQPKLLFSLSYNF